MPYRMQCRMPCERPAHLRAFFPPLALGGVIMGLLPLSAAALTPDETTPAGAEQQTLPDLGSGSLNESDTEKKLAALAKQLAAANNDSADRSWRTYLFNQAKEKMLNQLQQQSESMLQPLGHSSVSLDVSPDGDVSGSAGQLLLPLFDNPNRALTFSQVGVLGTDRGAVANIGLGQRWNTGRWQVGYSLFYDQYLEQESLRRGALGAEASGDYLRFSTNYYYPLSAMKAGQNAERFLRQTASGYDMTTRGYLPFYRQLGASVKYERYYGDNVDLFDSGNYRSDPSALEFGVNYTPVPLMSLTATHKQGDSGESQDHYSLTVNYRFGVPFEQQISARYVADAHALRGSRYDLVSRNNTPVLAFKQRKTLSVFLATPPWSLHGGESLELKPQVDARNKITAVSWQGDTHALSLTPPARGDQPDGWSIIMPQWDDSAGAANEYHLSLTVEDEKQQRVTSNWIVLKVEPPLTIGAGSGVYE
ncbi:YchO/YchP family invasin [Acerihabitans arboris]|uniref:YchO/YchP family invasin n=1 Tax=Acerihabitans arboris TaxID=2691583 RepID=A0A845SGP4_9GAMM|nr:YchO/YchP family invasin [Acerihabitans arboris]NDL63039.1 YchO/YchP family invasin [Acerihabitans arboris]